MENALAAGALPQFLLGELTALPSRSPWSMVLSEAEQD